jgi:putative OPT family oligopeptide transporter
MLRGPPFDGKRPLEEAKPADRSVPQLTARAIGSGMVFGAVLSLCNIYTGLKIGWGTNMSITAGLLSFGFWKLFTMLGAREYGILENNLNQTAASAGASISSAGLVAPIPALTMLTGQTLGWPALSLWVFSVALVGVVTAFGVRQQMLVVDNLPFPMGVATAGTLREMYARGSEAIKRVAALLAGAAAASALKVTQEVAKLGKLSIPGLGGMKLGGATMKNLGFAIDPSLLMVGVGAIIGTRAAASMLLGAIVTWGFLAPEVLELGWASAGKPEPDAAWFGSLVKWFLWPGVAMMVTASLTSVAMSGRSVLAALRGVSSAASGSGENGDGDESNEHEIPRKWFVWGLLGILVISVVCQVAFFGIKPWTAAIAVILTFMLATVAGRVAGETGITPVGAMGKVTQLTFGAIAPADPTSNLMAANVTGGAASQCADLLHDLRAGKILGAWPRHQAIAQVLGVLAGSLAGSAAYLVLVPNPKEMLLTKEWPAPAVAQWKAVAEVFTHGFGEMPTGSGMAMAIGGAIGIVLAVLEKRLPLARRKWVPSPGAIGLAVIIPADISIAMFLGAMCSLLLERWVRAWALRFVIPIAAGVIAGESLTGVGIAVQKILAG